MPTLIPYLSFSGKAEEALHFYEQALSGRITHMQRFKEAPGMAGPEADEWILHAVFEGAGFTFMASDGRDPSFAPTNGGNLSLSFDYKDPAAMEKAYENLSAEGKILMPMQDTFWGARFGICQDRYGYTWMFNHDKEQPSAPAQEPMMA